MEEEERGTRLLMGYSFNALTVHFAANYCENISYLHRKWAIKHVIRNNAYSYNKWKRKAYISRKYYQCASQLHSFYLVVSIACLLMPLTIATDCPSIGTIDHGTFSYVTGENVTGVRFECDEGYGMVGSDYLECSSNGRWNDTTPECQPVICESLPTIPNGQVHETGTTVGSRATYVCIKGFRMVGDAERECLGNSTWTGAQPECKRIVCKHPGAPSYGNASPADITDYPAGTVLTYRCIEGYNIMGSATSTCNETGSWTSPLPTCKVTDCGPPPNISNASPVYTSTVLGQPVTYACDDGFASVSVSVLVCLSTGAWSGILYPCIDSANISNPSAENHTVGIFTVAHHPTSTITSNTSTSLSTSYSSPTTTSTTTNTSSTTTSSSTTPSDSILTSISSSSITSTSTQTINTKDPYTQGTLDTKTVDLEKDFTSSTMPKLSTTTSEEDIRLTIDKVSSIPTSTPTITSPSSRTTESTVSPNPTAGTLYNSLPLENTVSSTITPKMDLPSRKATHSIPTTSIETWTHPKTIASQFPGISTAPLREKTELTSPETTEESEETTFPARITQGDSGGSTPIQPREATMQIFGIREGIILGIVAGALLPLVFIITCTVILCKKKRAHRAYELGAATRAREETSSVIIDPSKQLSLINGHVVGNGHDNQVIIYMEDESSSQSPASSAESRRKQLRVVSNHKDVIKDSNSNSDSHIHIPSIHSSRENIHNPRECDGYNQKQKHPRDKNHRRKRTSSPKRTKNDKSQKRKSNITETPNQQASSSINVDHSVIPMELSTMGTNNGKPAQNIPNLTTL